MASLVTCQVVYADTDGAVHMQLPIYIDPQGAVHVTTVDAVGDADEEGAILSRICLSSASSAEEARRASLRRALEDALSLQQSSAATAAAAEHGQHHHARDRAMERLRSMQEPGSLESRDALRRRLLEERSRSMNSSVEPLSPPRQHRCFLTYLEQRMLLSSH